jgi:hypothetical protein
MTHKNSAITAPDSYFWLHFHGNLPKLYYTLHYISCNNHTGIDVIAILMPTPNDFFLFRFAGVGGDFGTCCFEHLLSTRGQGQS